MEKTTYSASAREIAIEMRSEPPGKGKRWRIGGGKGGDGRERQSQ